jgi:hypothetical protein
LPEEMQFKISVMMASSNPASILLMERLGANTFNIPTDLTLAQLAAIRQAVSIPLDIYIEAPDDLGGFVRLYEIPEVVRVAAPVYLKFGLRNAPNIYPAGKHIESMSLALSRERVRRAKIGWICLRVTTQTPCSRGPALPDWPFPWRSRPVNPQKIERCQSIHRRRSM